MAEENNVSMQERFLDELVTSGKTCNVFLVNGIRLVGNLMEHDRFALVIKGQTQGHQLVYKHAVSTVALVV